MACGSGAVSHAGSRENLKFFQPISNLTTQRVAYNGDERPQWSVRNTAFEQQLCTKSPFTPFARQAKTGITSEVLYQLSYSGEGSILGLRGEPEGKRNSPVSGAHAPVNVYPGHSWLPVSRVRDGELDVPSEFDA